MFECSFGKPTESRPPESVPSLFDDSDFSRENFHNFEQSRSSWFRDYTPWNQQNRRRHNASRYFYQQNQNHRWRGQSNYDGNFRGSNRSSSDWNARNRQYQDQPNRWGMRGRSGPSSSQNFHSDRNGTNFSQTSNSIRNGPNFSRTFSSNVNGPNRPHGYDYEFPYDRHLNPRKPPEVSNSSTTAQQQRPPLLPTPAVVSSLSKPVSSDELKNQAVDLQTTVDVG